MSVLPSPRIPAPPRIPGLPDPLRRCWVPRDLDSVTTIGEEDPMAGGVHPDHAERLWRAVRRLYRTGVHPAIALCVRRNGVVVLDRAIGHARGNGPQDGRDVAKVPATPDTPFVIFSAAKAVTAVLAHVLDERGAFHVGDRVAEHVPEFARNGKDAITIEHVLSHRAGVPNLPKEVLDLDNLADEELLLRVIADARPRTRPGKLLAYHAVSGGFILAEVVRRTTGKDIRTVLEEELLGPLGFRWGSYGVAPEDVDQVALSYPTGAPPLPPVSTVLTRALGPHPDEVTRLSNDPRFLTGVIPAANVVTTANELSRFFELCLRGGTLDGVTVFEPRTIRRATVERAYRELDLTLGAPMRHGAGLMLGAQAISLFGPDTEHAFGHLGFTNVLGWADPERDLSVGLLTSGKPIVHHGLPDLWAITREVGRLGPKAGLPG
ncbi:beta-lactamase family protein [Conexibacter sp. SYSU D00693]|uniref:serine hydrolase domain-containing protein n=1 Tax=Conexibacter sp. SYSU D00693 TaxID=2812560 RepID=UPI001F11E493|nr:beta-lactamase family protein [Conexibacter sp. SYSU D00693]